MPTWLFSNLWLLTLFTTTMAASCMTPLCQWYCDTGDYGALEEAVLASPQVSEDVLQGVVFDLVSGGDMPSHMANTLLDRWKTSGHLQTFDPKTFLANMVRMMQQQEREDRAFFPDGLEVFVVNTPGVLFAARGQIFRSNVCPGMGKLFVRLHGYAAEIREVAVKKSNILKEEPTQYCQFG